MGINNIEVLIQHEVTMAEQQDPAAAVIKQLVAEHRAGLHPYGSMRRACPLCQRG